MFALARPVLPEWSEFLAIWFNSPEHGGRQFRTWLYGEGRPHLSFDHLRSALVALPSLEEQRVIVARVGELFALTDALEERVAAARGRAEKSPQSLLAKAFCGELVPTEAELARAEGRGYEPASVLLERIRAEREITARAQSTSRRRNGRSESPRRRGPRKAVL